MKTVRLFLTALLAASALSPLVAQHRNHGRKGYDPTVYMISVHEVDTFLMDCEARQQAALQNRLAAAAAIEDHKQTTRSGFHQPHQPQFIFASKNNRFSLALGGTIQLRTFYEFDGVVNNIDFVPADIPMHPAYNTSERIMMDGTASRLFLRAITNTRLGRIVVFVDGDFRGGKQGSYTPHMRSAFVSFLGFTAGRDVTTFCDLQAVAPTVDFNGPNAYNHRYTTMLRYEHSMWNNVVSFGVAAEIPKVSATYGEFFAPQQQRMPDFPLYLQVAWGRNRMSHIRASAILRNMYAYNQRTGSTTSLFGWGTQISGHIAIARSFDLFFNGTYGKGLSPYVQDLVGSGLDFTPNPAHPESIQAIPVLAWQAAARIHLVPEILSVSGGYSSVKVNHLNGFWAEDIYREGQYIFGNIFCNITPRMTLALEYLYGSRQDMNGDKNHANRANLLISYSF